MNEELPIIDDVNEITLEKHPEMHSELCNGCEEGECSND